VSPFCSDSLAGHTSLRRARLDPSAAARVLGLARCYQAEVSVSAAWPELNRRSPPLSLRVGDTARVKIGRGEQILEIEAITYEANDGSGDPEPK